MYFRGCAEASPRRRNGSIKNKLIIRLKSKGADWCCNRTARAAAALLALALAVAGLSSRATAQQLAVDKSAGAAFSAVTASMPAAPGQPPADPKPDGALYGTVVDSNGGVISGATATLSGPVSRTVTSDSGGNFSFTGLPAGTFNIQVAGSGMSPADVPNIVLRPGGVRFLPPVVLQVAAVSTSIKVFANPEELAEQQLQLQLHQKVLGFLPNYYSSYDWNAVHLWPKQKFELGYRSEVDPVAFVIIAGEAGLDQMSNRYPAYGGGVQGYAKRYGADYATDFIGTMIGDVALPTLFHQDPRYFYKGTGSFGSRALYAVSRTFICRGDSGHPEFDYSRIMGDVAAGGISNAYYPASDRGADLVFINAGVDLAANASTNLIREFVLPGLTSHVPKGIKVKSPIHF